MKDHGARLNVEISARIGDLDLTATLAARAETLALVGPNGAGKSSLLELLLGVRTALHGRIQLDGDTLLDTRSNINIPPERRRIGYVPQDYALFPHLTVYDNIAFAIGCAEPKLRPAARAERAQAVLSELGLSRCAGYAPHTLSGGERQRVALARALSTNPRALFFDEPLSALDTHARSEVRVFLANYLAQLDIPTIVVTHDARDARALATRIAVLEQGKISQVGSWDELARRPASTFVAKFIESYDR